MAREPYLWESIRDTLRARVKAGVYPAGTKLPSVRLLADEFDTSHMTVRRAVDYLVERDELNSRVGIGIFVPGEPNA